MGCGRVGNSGAPHRVGTRQTLHVGGFSCDIVCADVKEAISKASDVGRPAQMQFSAHALSSAHSGGGAGQARERMVLEYSTHTEQHDCRPLHTGIQAALHFACSFGQRGGSAGGRGPRRHPARSRGGRTLLRRHPGLLDSIRNDEPSVCMPGVAWAAARWPPLDTASPPPAPRPAPARPRPRLAAPAGPPAGPGRSNRLRAAGSPATGPDAAPGRQTPLHAWAQQAPHKAARRHGGACSRPPHTPCCFNPRKRSEFWCL